MWPHFTSNGLLNEILLFYPFCLSFSLLSHNQSAARIAYFLQNCSRDCPVGPHCWVSKTRIWSKSHQCQCQLVRANYYNEVPLNLNILIDLHIWNYLGPALAVKMGIKVGSLWWLCLTWHSGPGGRGKKEMVLFPVTALCIN